MSAETKAMTSVDQRISEMVAQVLRTSGHSVLGRVRVTEAHGRIVLHGEVPSFYLKQVAQEAAMRLPTVGAVRNELVVKPLNFAYPR